MVDLTNRVRRLEETRSGWRTERTPGDTFSITVDEEAKVVRYVTVPPMTADEWFADVLRRHAGG